LNLFIYHVSVLSLENAGCLYGFVQRGDGEIGKVKNCEIEAI
jgi:hypothetical protein